MQSMTIEQLRAASNAGGVSGVTLKGQGGAFLVQIVTCSGQRFRYRAVEGMQHRAAPLR
ncbi:hypothetical protein [Nitrosospira briensis]|uniref:hypothetical protein n=1 Tax=Nitrosospira briensis TaxID=35799 RepID=UPI0018D107E0|nr:hypothetical protein [Nitrosospira briensis]